ncbi:MAG: glycerol-3-phosphate 1-O-acyltransferase PlsY [Candidatus Pacebacteria bacterium]|nr:glycerol-3-phosphate 1-O-acyltransferase PlsY [Candidatus Paceibacterota bacterium]
MQTYALGILLVVLAYVAGSVPFGFLLAQTKGIDIRTRGSGNIGATNLTRTLGRKWGIACFFLDFAKGLAPVTATVILNESPVVPVAAAGAAVAGHVWPVFLRFKGGKGMATSIGALLALAPWSVVMAVLLWIILFLLTGYVSLASLGAAVILPLSALVVSMNPVTVILLTVIALLIIGRHRSNIVRLWRGEEHRFSRNREHT